MIKQGFLWTILLLMTVILLNPMPENAAAAKKQVIILNLPYLPWTDITEDYPHLFQLLSSGATGLVKFPAASTHYQFIRQGLRVSGATFRQSYTIIPAVGSSNANLPKKISPVVIIEGKSFVTSNSGWGNSVESLSNTRFSSVGTESILHSYRQVKDWAKIIAITFPPKEVPNPEQSRYSPQPIGLFYDSLVSDISDQIDFSTSLLVVYSQQALQYSKKNNPELTQIFLKGPGFNNGVLYSPSTRKQGIITFNELRSILQQFLNPGKTKPVIRIKNEPKDWRVIAKRQNDLNKNYSIRWPLLTGYGYLLLGVIFLLSVGFILHFPQKIVTALVWGYLFLITVPAAFLIEALIDPLDWFSIILFTLCITGVLFGSAYFIANKSIINTLIWISLITVGVVIGDGLLNGNFESKSFLGYSLVAGARYYGIGNEYMGILLGAYIVGVSLYSPCIRQWRRQILWLITFLIGLTLIHPNFGADVGGGITAMMGLGLVNYLWLKQPIRIQEIGWLLFITIFALTLAGTWDLYFNSDSMSHLGQLLIAISKYGLNVFFDMVIRKIGLNLRLIISTPLSISLIVILAAIPILYRFPPASLKKIIEKHYEAVAGLIGLSITALIGFLTNDSGIVSAAMIFMFGIGLVFTLIVNDLNRDNTGRLSFH